MQDEIDNIESRLSLLEQEEIITLFEKKSKRKATAILNLVKSGEYSPSYALIVAEELNDNGKL